MVDPVQPLDASAALLLGAWTLLSIRIAEGRVRIDSAEKALAWGLLTAVVLAAAARPV